MSRKQSVFLAAALLFGSSLALADSRPRVLLSGDLGLAPSQRVWAWNLEAEPVEILAGSSAAAKVRVEPGEALEVTERLQAKGSAGLSEDGAVLLLAAPRDFVPSALIIDGEARVRLEKVGRRVRTRVLRPAWASSLLAMAAGKGRLGAGDSAEVPVEADLDGQVRFAAALEKGSTVKLIVKDEQGKALRSFTLASGAPVRLQLDLGAAAELPGGRLAVQVHRGGTVAGISHGADGGLRPILAKSVVCSSSPSNVVYSGSYTYSVYGCPANTCGELNIKRNGNWEFTGSWICTDSSGNATKGPWNWSDKASDETGEPIFIRWPGAGSPTTDETLIIVDKACAQTYRTSPDGAPPTSFAGYATDNTWGAGFDFGGKCYCYFWDTTTSTLTAPSASMSPSGRWYTSWSCTPPSTVSGHSYDWYACCDDGNCGWCTSHLYFTKP